MLIACLKRLLQNERGAILPIFGLMVIVLVVVGGVAIDVSRAVNSREKLSYAIDAAALAVATNLSTSVMTNDEITQAIEDSFRANLDGADFLDKAIENLSFVVDSDAGTINISSSASLSTYFLDIGGYGLTAFGPDTFSFGTSAQVAYSRFEVELALVVDVTGSMGWPIGSTSTIRIDALEDAATSLLNILIPDGTSEDDSKVKISIIPYSEGVNLGQYASKVANGAQGSRNCVTERLGSAQYTDDAYDYDKNNSSSYFGGGSSGCASSPQLEPLTAKRQKLESAIGKLQPSGGTSGQTGVAWGWYSLSPKWSNLWPDKSTPAAYDNTDVLKFALIMTDGDFNRYYYKRTLSKNSCKNAKRNGYVTETCKNGYNEYWYPGGSGGYSGESSKRAMKMCDGMKAEGIQIYSIYFGTNESSSEARVMKDCASDEDKTFYAASSSGDLINAFSNIAKKIQQIYLSK